MTKKQKWLLRIGIAVVLVGVLIGLAVYSVRHGDYAFPRAVSDDQREQRLSLVTTAQSWLGTEEGSLAHTQLLDIYNAHEPLAQGYKMTMDDNWCAAFVSTTAIQSGLTDIIPTECGCQRQIDLWQELGRWEEADDYVPLPGDIIYYSSKGPLTGDNTAWSDHVGIVVGTWRGWIKVIEGNYADMVAYRYIPVDAYNIRGFAIPDYEKQPAE